MEEEITKGKKRKRYMKINLFETSVVGIPAYPDAHFSLIKALNALNDNTIERRETQKMTEEIKTVESVVAPVVEQVVEVAKEEAKVEVAKETSAQEIKAVETEAKDDSTAKFVAMLEKAIGDAVEKITVKRGLIEPQKDKSAEVEKTLKDMSIGELAVKSGFFK